MSALTRKTWADLMRRRARTVLTVCTVGLAIASLATLAVPALMGRTMQGEIRAARLHDIAMRTHDLVLSAAQLDAMRRLPNVAAFDARVMYSTRVAIGARQEQAVVWGLDLASQPVDRIHVVAGRLPRPGELVTDAGNGRAAGFPVAIGDRVEVRGSAGRQTPLRVSGTGHSLATSPSAIGPDQGAVFYASAATVRSLAGARGVNFLAFRLAGNSPGAQARTIAAVRAYLEGLTGKQPFADLPDTRAPGDWPGRSQFRQIISLFDVISLLALLCALFLIANTMNTLVAEQAAEIAIIKTLGGRRRQIAAIYIRTAALLGVAGAGLGAVLGAAIAYLLTGYFATAIFDVHAGFAISLPVVLASLGAGPVLAVASSAPGLRRALRRPVAETLADHGMSGYGTGWLDRLAARSQLLSGPARMGVRNVLRQKRRSAATAAQVAVAVALALALFAVGRSVTAAANQAYGMLRYDLAVSANNGAIPLGSRARSIAAGTPDITQVEPVLENQVEYHGHSYAALGFGVKPLYRYRLQAGRWFTMMDTAATTPAVVLGPAVARTARARAGQMLTLATAAGPTRVHVIGIDTGQLDNGGVVYFPLATLQRLTGMEDATNTLWLTATSASHATSDRAAAAVRDRLAAAGYQVGIQKHYVQAADNNAQNHALLTIIEAMGLLVVAITLMGLVSTLTMGVIERRREIGILRCLGARARHIRCVFSAEGITLAAIGWTAGVPLAWLLCQAVLIFIRHDFGIRISAVFPAVSVPIALVATITLTITVIRGPLRRATRVQAGRALRYE